MSEPPLERLFKRAGLQPWPQLFHAMRASRETELAKQFPIHAVTAWRGNTPRIALKHYLQVTDADFERAAETSDKGGAERGSRWAQNTAQSRRGTNGGESHSSRATSAEFVTCAIPGDTQRDSAQMLSGEAGIRTLGQVAPTLVFKTSALDRSATSPVSRSLPARAFRARAPDSRAAPGDRI